MRKYEINNTLPYERDMYDKLECISFSDLVTMITFNKPLNQSADYKYRRIVYFINLLFNRYNRPEIAVKLIEKYWNKLPKQTLIEGLFIYCDFEIFKKYWKKNRTHFSDSFISIVFRTDEIERAEWLLVDKKFTNIIDEENVYYISVTPKERWSFLNDEAYKLLLAHPKVTEIALDNGYESLYPETVKDIFLFYEIKLNNTTKAYDKNKVSKERLVSVIKSLSPADMEYLTNLYEQTGEEDFLPAEVQDIFIF